MLTIEDVKKGNYIYFPNRSYYPQGYGMKPGRISKIYDNTVVNEEDNISAPIHKCQPIELDDDWLWYLRFEKQDDVLFIHHVEDTSNKTSTLSRIFIKSASDCYYWDYKEGCIKFFYVHRLQNFIYELIK